MDSYDGDLFLLNLDDDLFVVEGEDDNVDKVQPEPTWTGRN